MHLHPVSYTLISFVWAPGERFLAGTGGTQNYTAGHVRELNRRGIAAQVVTVGVGEADGRDGFTDVPFRSLPPSPTSAGWRARWSSPPPSPPSPWRAPPTRSSTCRRPCAPATDAACGRRRGTGASS